MVLNHVILSNIYLSPALAQSGRYSNWHMGRWMMGNWGMGWFGMIFMVLFWGLIIINRTLLMEIPGTFSSFSFREGQESFEKSRGESCYCDRG